METLFFLRITYGENLPLAITPSITVMCDFSLPVYLTITDFAPSATTVTVCGILEVVGGFKNKTTVLVLCLYGNR